MALTIQQERAKYALERVEGLGRVLNDESQKEFISYASGLR